MSVESDQYTAKVTELVAQKDQVIALVTTQQTNLAALGQQITDLIAANASDAEFAAAARASLPVITSVVNELDTVTPDGTPVIETAGARRRR